MTSFVQLLQYCCITNNKYIRYRWKYDKGTHVDQTEGISNESSGGISQDFLEIRKWRKVDSSILYLATNNIIYYLL